MNEERGSLFGCANFLATFFFFRHEDDRRLAFLTPAVTDDRRLFLLAEIWLQRLFSLLVMY